MELPVVGASSDSAPPQGKGWLAASVSLLGGSATAVAATACCWLPFALVTLGVSSAGATAIFFEYRPLLLATTAALLAASWWFTLSTLFRSAPTLTASGAATGGGCCASTQALPCCGPATGRGWCRIAILSVVSVFAVVSGARPDLVFSKAASAAPLSLEQGVAGFVVTIGGMDCECAAPSTEKELQQLLNDPRIKIDAKPRKVLIPVGDGLPTKQDVRSAIEKTGYSVVQFEQVPTATSAGTK